MLVWWLENSELSQSWTVNVPADMRTEEWQMIRRGVKIITTNHISFYILYLCINPSPTPSLTYPHIPRAFKYLRVQTINLLNFRRNANANCEFILLQTETKKFQEYWPVSQSISKSVQLFGAHLENALYKKLSSHFCRNSSLYSKIFC